MATLCIITTHNKPAELEENMGRTSLVG